jgi:putative redox protein
MSRSATLPKPACKNTSNSKPCATWGFFLQCHFPVPLIVSTGTENVAFRVTCNGEAHMSIHVAVRYDGDLHCSAVHGPSGDRILTDAPVDNRGRGEHFSPTDLVGTAMGSCMLTIMGIAAQDKDIDISGASAEIVKEMSAVPRRHISRLSVTITLPAALDDRERRILDAAARTCPVAASLGPDTEVDLEFLYK